MKTIVRNCLLPLLGLAMYAGTLTAQELRTEVFDLLNLDMPGLEEVAKFHSAGDDKAAATALLGYYRSRTVRTPDLDPENVTISETEQKWADDALDHTFFAHKGYQPSFNYGKDIDWKYWPVQDNELRWQLHRHKWFVPMGKAYKVTGDEKYASEWVFQYMDWIAKNPLFPMDRKEYELVSEGKIKGEWENVRFAWRPLEVSHRLQDQTLQFQLFLDSPSFTPEFLTEFLVNYHRHAVHILNNYSDQGNHLLFEAQRMIYAGSFFPEFKDAATWRKSGMEILNREISVQVYDDGGQFELDPHYHLAAINIFCKALRMADVAGFRSEFSQNYVDMIEKMIMFYMNISYPDYMNPCFSDAKLVDKDEMIENYKDWLKIFPQNDAIRYFATEGREGQLPDNLSIGYLKSGFFVFRNGWGQDALQMVVKAGPKAFWHCQPDNGTFELWYSGRNLSPDSGSYVYAGNGEVMKWRNWFRQTRVHNTLTLDGRDLDSTFSETRLWKPEGDVQILVTENQSYEGLRHRRSVFFVRSSYFVIVDEAFGDATGTVNLNWQMPEGNLESDGFEYRTCYDSGANMALRCFGPSDMTVSEEDGWRSTDYRKKSSRKIVSYNVEKAGNSPERFITVICPYMAGDEIPEISARFAGRKFKGSSLKVEVTVGGVKDKLEYELK